MIYYGLVSGLPDPQVGRPLGYDFASLKEMLLSFLSPEDSALAHHFFYRIDLQNLQSLAEHNDFFVGGGNLNREETEHWFRQRHLDIPPFDQIAIPESDTPQELLNYLHALWQAYYHRLAELSDENTKRLWRFEIAYKNFTAGHLQKLSGSADENRFLEGGDFDRFAYARLVIGDIQAEHPFLATVLSSLEMPHPQERQAAIIEKRRKFLDYAAFFDAFGMTGVMSWVLKAFEVIEAENLKGDSGRNRLKTFSDNIIHTAEQQLI
jgi:hypothetical protein